VTTGEQSSSYPEPQTGAAELREAMPPRRVSLDDNPSPEQIEIYRRMTPGRRLELAENLYWSARRLKHAWLRSLHPAWSEEAVEAEVTRLFSHARS
jgi:hypothetical protein